MNICQRCLQLAEMNPHINVENVSLLSFGKDNINAPSTIASNVEVMGWMYRNIYYISDIHLGHQIARHFPNGATDADVKSFVKKVARELFSSDFKNGINRWNEPIVLFGGDIAELFEVSRLFYAEFVKCWNKLEQKYNRTSVPQRYIYAILGNHELWDFNTIEDCVDAYQSLFDSLGIFFLNNRATWCGKYELPTVRKEDDSVTYLYQMRYIHNIMIVGGIGFAGYNSEFNANYGIYRDVVDRNREISETKKWELVYQQAIETAKEKQCLLLILTHNPIIDWKKDKQPDSGFIYLYGHDHRNYLYHDDDTNTHVFANNQVGYMKANIHFKKAYIYERMNPFVRYEDGFHEINSHDYLRFYDYSQENIDGNKLIERQIKNNDAQFYMIKHSGYYGFFLVSPKHTYICAGGRIKKICKSRDIEKFDMDFSNMISTCLSVLSPYRNAQEKISNAVKSFGGDGKIHGCIIDIDFFNHIMLNPSDGKITYYNSLVFGQIKSYETMLELLCDNNKMLEEEYKQQIELSGDSFSNVLVKSRIDIAGEVVQIDIKNSTYTISNRMNQLQRLFDKKILRDWNEELLIKDKNSSIKQLE